MPPTVRCAKWVHCKPCALQGPQWQQPPLQACLLAGTKPRPNTAPAQHLLCLPACSPACSPTCPSPSLLSSAEEAVHDAVLLLDRAMSVPLDAPESLHRAALAACLLLAGRQAGLPERLVPEPVSTACTACETCPACTACTAQTCCAACADMCRSKVRLA